MTPAAGSGRWRAADERALPGGVMRLDNDTVAGLVRDMPFERPMPSFG